ncbi:MAG: hypothetical protein PVG65_00825 [Candidatus Thorarchaeota archaeon]|jgi:hypothetical protein
MKEKLKEVNVPASSPDMKTAKIRPTRGEEKLKKKLDKERKKGSFKRSGNKNPRKLFRKNTKI